MNPLQAVYDTSGAAAAAGAGAGIFLIVWLLFALAVFAFWLWMLIDVLTSSMPTNDKVLWALIVCFFPLVGSLIYFFVRRGSARTAR